MSFPVFIGYDRREADAYAVCESSLKRHSSIDLEIVKLDIENLKAIGLYRRPYTTTNGQMVDGLDSRPFSTEFAFSRFLVPSLTGGWAAFVDCDFLYTADIAELMPLLDDKYAVMVVKHAHEPSETIKMDGVSQGSYPRKNWSSFVLWNSKHPSNAELTIDAVNTQPGKWLHGFSWLKDDEIGEIPIAWNWLAGVNAPLKETPKAIHYTLGVPSMKGHEHTPYADLWREESTRLDQESKNGKALFRQYGSKQYALRSGAC